MKSKKLYKFDKVLLSIFFCLLIYIPFAMGIIEEDKTASSVEKRNLTKLPLWPQSFKEIIEYPPLFNSYYSDHFGLRELFTKNYFKIVNKIGGKTSFDDVTVGQNGWLFLGNIKKGYQGYNDPIGDAINVNLFSPKELIKFAESIMTLKNWLNKQGIKYIYVIAPNKHTIYFEQLPKYIKKKNNKSASKYSVVPSPINSTL